MSSTVISPLQISEAEVELGGRSAVPCFSLLDGFFQDPESGEKARVTIPITKLPATLGRSHDTDDEFFFGLGKKKALSRKQCRISYRDIQGGKVEWDAKAAKLAYKHPGSDGSDQATLNTEPDDELPPKGFFVIECLGKNRILVNQKRVDQGNAAVLVSGSSLRVSSYTLYFLLPKDATPTEHAITITPSSPKKRKPTPDAAPSSSNAGRRAKASQDELESMPVETLLERMTEAIDNNLWERRHQLIGAAIALHAVRDSALDPNIQSVAMDGGVSRSDIMVWVEESPKYKTWVEQMLTKMESRSYQAAITKSLLKAGFTRTGSSGRYIKWYLPKDIPVLPQSALKKKEKPKAPKDGGGKVDDQGGKSDGDHEGEEEEEVDNSEEEEDRDEDDNIDDDDVGGNKTKEEDEDGDEEVGEYFRRGVERNSAQAPDKDADIDDLGDD